MRPLLQKLLRLVFHVFGAIAGLAILYFVSALILSSFTVNSTFAQAKQNGIEIFVTSNGVHTDLVLPVVTPYIDWRQKLPVHQYEGVDSTYTHLAFGWGDRKFYMETPEWKDLTPTVAITAALWPTRTAMHVEYIERPLIPNKYQRPIQITPDQYQLLIAYIIDSFQQQNGEFILIPGKGYTSEDNFYEAHGKFYILKNCNNWVNQGLKSMGVKTALWAPIPYAIMRHLRD